MRDSNTLFTIVVDKKLKHRYMYLTLNHHISKNHMANMLRDEFLRVLNDAERAAGLQVTNFVVKHYGDGAEYDGQGRERKEDNPSLKQNSVDENEQSGEGEEVVV